MNNNREKMNDKEIQVCKTGRGATPGRRDILKWAGLFLASCCLSIPPAPRAPKSEETTTPTPEEECVHVQGWRIPH